MVRRREGGMSDVRHRRWLCAECRIVCRSCVMMLVVLAILGCSAQVERVADRFPTSAANPAFGSASESAADSNPPQVPRLDANLAWMPDGTELRLRTWGNAEDPVLVLLGVHGFNDYGQAFAGLEVLIAQQPRMRIYAYDQRGHGLSGELGRWPGADRLQADLRVMVQLLRHRYPKARLVVLGESMGGAVVLTTLAGEPGLDADAVALLAPAVWGSKAMPWYQRLGLWLARKLVPGASFSAAVARDLGIRPTDDPDVARALATDPLVQKTARADTLHGLTALMTQAAGQSVPDKVEVLVLYGLRDTVIPPGAVCAWLQLPQMDSSERMRLLIYPQGYHLLTRQTRSQEVLEDLQRWLEGELLAQQNEPVMESRPSGLEEEPFWLEEGRTGFEEGQRHQEDGQSGRDSAMSPVKALQRERSLSEARETVCALPAVGLRERP